MDYAFVDKLAKENNGVTYLLNRLHLFDRTVDATGLKTKDSKETLKTFSTIILKTNPPQIVRVDDGTEFVGEFKNLTLPEHYNFTLQWVEPRLNLLNVQNSRKEKVLYR